MFVITIFSNNFPAYIRQHFSDRTKALGTAHATESVSIAEKVSEIHFNDGQQVKEHLPEQVIIDYKG